MNRLILILELGEGATDLGRRKNHRRKHQKKDFRTGDEGGRGIEETCTATGDLLALKMPKKDNVKDLRHVDRGARRTKKP